MKVTKKKGERTRNTDEQGTARGRWKKGGRMRGRGRWKEVEGKEGRAGGKKCIGLINKR